MESPDGQELPGLNVRMVPGQYDDVLVCASDLDFLGWSRDDYEDRFELKGCGVSVPRDAPNQHFAGSSAPSPTARCTGEWSVARGLRVGRSEVAEVRVTRQRRLVGPEVKSTEQPRDLWFRPGSEVPAGLEVAEGPLNPECDSMVVLVRNTRRRIISSKGKNPRAPVCLCQNSL